jgi:RIO-like serine/threonine protein kinase
LTYTAAQRPFDRKALEHGATVLSKGRWANAVLYRVEQSGGEWVVKDFRTRPFVVRHTVGRVLISRECKALRRMQGIAGAPQDAFRIDACALAYRFVPGWPLNEAQLGPRLQQFFVALERVLQQVHAVAGLVHLDVRTSSNVLVTEQGEPVLIDFQSHLSTRWMPTRMRRWLEGFDMAGVYKHWARLSPATMGDARHDHLKRMNRWRRLWILRGYLGARKRRPETGK